MYHNKVTALLQGGSAYPDIRGTVIFSQTGSGILVEANVTGLPENECGIFGFHIHDKGDCSSPQGNGFPNSGVHYNPKGVRHPCHAGDMLPLFGCRGRAYLAFLTDRFILSEIIGKSVIVHSMPDDFTTDPSGNSGDRIACGIIEPASRRRYR